MAPITESAKIFEVKRQKSLDVKRESLFSSKAIDSPFSRDSNSTATNGVESCRDLKKM